MPPDRFPWPRVMQMGFGTLRLAPHAFWNMTLKELVAAFEPSATAPPRHALDQMMQRWPDHTQDE